MARRFQFRLRTMLIAVTVVALGCVVTQLAVNGFRERLRLERIRRQRAATDRIWDSPHVPANRAEPMR